MFFCELFVVKQRPAFLLRAILFLALLSMPVYGDFGWANSETFPLDALLHTKSIGWAESDLFSLDLLLSTTSVGRADSEVFSLELLRVHRGWADSPDFWICLMHGDFDVDCCVNLADLDMFVGHWLASGCSEPDWCGWADFQRSGSVDFVDFALLAENWLTGCQN